MEGNKNKIGPILGESCHINNVSVDLSTPLEGNKNKTGQTLGDSTHKICDSDIKQGQQASLQFRGNKNAIRAKLGLMPGQDNDNTLKMTEETVNASSQRNLSEKIRTENSLAACHDLSCIQQQDNDNIIYDIVNPPHKRKRNIPDIIHLNTNNSVDYKRCIQQNGRNFGFLPLNDLMVYTGKEVTWDDVPNIIEAHKIIRNSAMPNFMGARIPVRGQFNITA